MKKEPFAPVTRRRTFLLGALGAAALAFVGLNWRPRRSDTGESEHQPSHDGPGRDGPGRDSPGRDRPGHEGPTDRVKNTLLAFIGALFGRELTAADRIDLSHRLDTFFGAAGNRHDGEVLAQHLDGLAAKLGAAAFDASDDAQKASMVDQVMLIDPKSLTARVLSRISRDQRDFYRMRWSTVPTLAWLYRHSEVAWRARGYQRWPGVGGDWHEILARGAPYP